MLANLPNFGVQKPASQFGAAQTLPQGYSNLVLPAIPAYQQMLELQKSNPRAAYLSVFNRRDPIGQQYYDLQRASIPATQYASYLARNGGGNAQDILRQFGTSGLGQYESRLPEYGDWMEREIKRANASGMLSSGLGALVPGLAMMAFPGAGLAKIATSTAIGGLGGGVKGALLGGLGSALAPNISVPGGLSSLARAPVQAATNVVKQFANPLTFARQAASSGIGSLNQRNT